MDDQVEATEAPDVRYSDLGIATQLAVMLVTDEDTGWPLVGLRFIGQKDGLISAPVFCRMNPATARELGATMVGASATATLYGSTNRYVAELQKAGKREEAQAIQDFAAWLGENDGE